MLSGWLDCSAEPDTRGQVRRHPPEPGRAHLQGEVRQPGLLDPQPSRGEPPHSSEWTGSFFALLETSFSLHLCPQSMQAMGNSKGRAVYEARLPEDFRRPQTDQAVEAFARQKYEKKKFIKEGWTPTKPPDFPVSPNPNARGATRCHGAVLCGVQCAVSCAGGVAPGRGGGDRQGEGGGGEEGGGAGEEPHRPRRQVGHTPPTTPTSSLGQ